VRWRSHLPSINRSNNSVNLQCSTSLVAAIAISTDTDMAEIDDTAKGEIDWSDWAPPGKDDGKAV
jgi:hypothetical protein